MKFAQVIASLDCKYNLLQYVLLFHNYHQQQGISSSFEISSQIKLGTNHPLSNWVFIFLLGQSVVTLSPTLSTICPCCQQYLLTANNPYLRQYDVIITFSFNGDQPIILDDTFSNINYYYIVQLSSLRILS